VITNTVTGTDKASVMGSAPTTLTGSTPVGGNGTYTTYGRVVQRVQLLDLRRQLAQIILLIIVRNFINPLV
jgi:hypothetical protein